MIGVQTNFITHMIQRYKMEIYISKQSWIAIESADNTDNDVRFKQTAYAELSFNSSETLTLTSTNMLLYDNNNNILDKEPYRTYKTWV